MEEADFISVNIFDITVILVVVISAVLSWFRGFVREVLTIFAWVGALAITLWNFPYVSHALEGVVKSPLVRGGLTSIGLFFVSWLVIAIFNAMVIKYVKSSEEVGALDKGMGFFFGGFRGVFIVSMGFLIMAFFIPIDSRDEGKFDDEEDKDKVPVWLEESRLRPYVLEGAALLAQGLPDYIDLGGVSKAFEQKEEKDDAPLFGSSDRKFGEIFKDPKVEDREEEKKGQGTVRLQRIDIKELDAFFGSEADDKDKKKDKEKSSLW